MTIALVRNFLLVLTLGLAACATIMHGTHQDVGITSAPTGATVTIDGLPSGSTPLIAKLTRKANHFVRIELPRYEPFDFTLTHSVSGWVWGNVAIGGLIGLGVDAISGGMYKLTPEQLSANLATSTPASVNKPSASLYIFTVLKPAPNWQKIGQLQAR